MTRMEFPGTSSETPLPVMDAVEFAEVTILSPGNRLVACRTGAPFTATLPIGVIIAVAVSAIIRDAGKTTAIMHARIRSTGFLTASPPKVVDG